MKTHAPAPKKNAAPVVATAAPSNLFQRRPFPKPEETEEDTPEVQGRELDFSQPAPAMSIPLYPPSPAVQRQPEMEEERRPEEEDLPVQAKLTIGQPGDKYEQEADATAAKVMRMTEPAGGQAVQRVTQEEDELRQRPRLQREPMPEEEAKEDDLAQARFQVQRQAMPEEEDDEVMESPLQRAEMKEDEEESLQGKPQIQAQGTASEAPANFDSQLAQHKGSGQPLSDETRAFMEPRFGADFSNVRVHETPNLANAIQAQAFTHGQDIYFNSGKYNPGSSGGKELLAHELTHVVQQSGSQIQRKDERTNSEQTYNSSSTSAKLTPKKIKVWINSFIPNYKIDGPPGSECFLGDNRSFSNKIHASSRTHQEIEVEPGTLKALIDWKKMGTTHEVDCGTNRIIDKDTASIGQLSNGPILGRNSADINIFFSGAAKNPLVKLAPAINFQAVFRINPMTRICDFEINHDGFPGYEAYITADGGSGIPVYTYDPNISDESPYSLFPFLGDMSERINGVSF